MVRLTPQTAPLKKPDNLHQAMFCDTRFAPKKESPEPSGKTSGGPRAGRRARNFDDVAQTHQPESENSMPQPLGSEQEILFRNLGLWQEKSAVLNRFNQLET
jgi:hypothetical protein